jgi:pilus assembly protein CpaE
MPANCGERMAECASGERSALIGLSKSGVSDVNLAAAIASDGHAEKVVLALRSPSGSLRSRAARAGIDLVVDLDGVSPAPSAEMDAAPVPEPLQNGDGGRISAAPGPALAPEGARAPILTFCSGRGGVGKTSVVACAAVAAASWGMRVEVVDLDLSCGNLYAMLGLARGTDLSRLSAEDLGDSERLGRLGAPCGERIRVWGPCERPETSELVSGIGLRAAWRPCA